MIRIGIDNGFDGAVAAIDDRYQVVCAELMPTLKVGRGGKWALDVQGLHCILRELRRADKDVFAVLEEARPMPKQGVTSTFKTGFGYGAAQGLLIALGIPHQVVTPRRWQQRALKGIEGDDPKARAVLCVQRALPGLELRPGRRRKPHDGLADAGCMALVAIVLRPPAVAAKPEPQQAALWIAGDREGHTRPSGGMTVDAKRHERAARRELALREEGGG